MILHLEHDGPRSAPIFNQALINSGISFTLSKTSDLKSAMKNADVILHGCFDYLDDFDRLNLWNKVVHYDYNDPPYMNKIQEEIFNKAQRYFKRSKYNKERATCNKAFDLDYAAMSEYYIQPTPKVYDIGCFFSHENPYLGQRRRNLLSTLEKRSLPNSIIGSEHYGAEVRNLTKDNVNFKDYLRKLRSCKIVFTAYPENWDGDSRTWEAFASKALVFKDKSWINIPNQVKAGEHFEEFDSSNTDSIEEAIEKAIWYLAHDKEREKIANNGYNFVKRYHRPANRLRYVLSWATLAL